MYISAADAKYEAVRSCRHIKGAGLVYRLRETIACFKRAAASGDKLLKKSSEDMNKHYHKYKQAGDCGGKKVLALLKFTKRDAGASTKKR